MDNYDFHPLSIHRRNTILKSINTRGSGLEIGAGYLPLFPKRLGYNVKTLDHISEEDLKEKYKKGEVNVSGTENVDFVWNGEPYAEIVGEKRFDWIVASHVIEHTPDFIGFLNDCSSILNEQGVLALIVPDRRYTLDYFRSTSSLGSIIDAHLQKRTRPSPGAVLDVLFLETNVYRTSNNPWDRDLSFLEIPNSNTYNEQINFTGYKDIHVWVFTPSHFRMIIEDLYLCGAIDLREKSVYPGKDREFYIILSKDGQGPKLSRLELARMIHKERKTGRLKAGRGTGFINNVLPVLIKNHFGGIWELLRRIKRTLKAIFYRRKP